MMAAVMVADVLEDFQVLQDPMVPIIQPVAAVPADIAAMAETAVATPMVLPGLVSEFILRLLQAPVAVAVAPKARPQITTVVIL
jgi:hypothetical protein